MAPNASCTTYDSAPKSHSTTVFLYHLVSITTDWFPRKHTLSWRLVWSMFIKVCSWDQYLKRKEWKQSFIQNEKLAERETGLQYCKNSALACYHGGLQSLKFLQSCHNLGWGGWNFIPLHWSIWNVGFPRKKAKPLEDSSPFSQEPSP